MKILSFLMLKNNKIKLLSLQRSSNSSNAHIVSWQLVEKLLSCGEFDFQSLLMETLMTFAMSCKGWREVLSSWFAPVSPTIAEAVSLLDARQYDYVSFS